MNPKKLETFFKTTSAGIPCTLRLGIEAVEFQLLGFYYRSRLRELGFRV